MSPANISVKKKENARTILNFLLFIKDILILKLKVVIITIYTVVIPILSGIGWYVQSYI